MIWSLLEEENPLVISSPGSSQSSIHNFSYAQPIGYATEVVDAMSQIADDIKSDIYHKTVGYGLIAVGAGVLVATRGAGWKASGIIMNTGLQNLAEVSE